MARGLYIDPTAGRETVRAYGDRWLGGQLYRPGTVDRVERTLRVHVYPVLGRLALAQVRPSHIQGWVKGLDLAPSTRPLVDAALAKPIGAAVET